MKSPEQQTPWDAAQFLLGISSSSWSTASVGGWSGKTCVSSESFLSQFTSVLPAHGGFLLEFVWNDLPSQLKCSGGETSIWKRSIHKICQWKWKRKIVTNNNRTTRSARKWKSNSDTSAGTLSKETWRWRASNLITHQEQIRPSLNTDNVYLCRNRNRYFLGRPKWATTFSVS